MPEATSAVEPPPAPAPVDPRKPGDYRPGLLPGLAAVVPGALLHGSGVWVAGDRDTALALLKAQGAGLAAIAAGGTVLALTGAARRLSGPTIAVVVLGGGLFVTPFAADLYGALLGGTQAVGPRRTPRGEVRVGHRYVHDPHFAYRNLVHVDGQVWLGAWSAQGDVLTAADDDNLRGRLQIAYRLLGPAAGPRAAAGASWLELRLAGTYHGYRSDGFSTLAGEGALAGRYDLANVGAPLRGSFVQAHVGWGLELYDYDLPGVSMGEDANEMLLTGFGWGVWLGQPERGHGEVVLLYDHRRDGYVGALGGGFAGQVGVTGRWAFAPDSSGDTWGLQAELRRGLATFAGVDLLYRWGSR